MCGRYTHLYTWKQLHHLLSLVSPEVSLPLRYNVAPTQCAPVVVLDRDSQSMTLRFMRWGFVPSWSKSMPTGKPLINARADGIESKPSFRAAFRLRRCIVPVSGFYEWQQLDSGKSGQPHYVSPAGPSEVRRSDPWLLAGLWEAWHDPSLPRDAPMLESFVIITTEPNTTMARIHHRMPVILDPVTANRWLVSLPDSESTIDAQALLRPCPAEWLAIRPVSSLVNNPRHDSIRCIQEPEKKDLGSIFDQGDKI